MNLIILRSNGILSLCLGKHQMRDILNIWLKRLQFEAQYSINTILSYRTDLESFFEFMKKHHEEELSREKFRTLTSRDVKSWLARRRMSGISVRSNARALSSLRMFCKFAQQQHKISTDAVFEIRFPRKRHTLPRPIQYEDIISMIKAVDSKPDWALKRDQALIILIYSAGLRISEALNIKQSNIVEMKIRVIGKGKKERIVPLLDIAQDAIDKYMQACPFEVKDFIFLGKRGGQLSRTLFARTIRNLRIKIGLQDTATTHALRHSCATHLLQNGVGIRSVQELLGHASLSSTAIYTKVDANFLLEQYDKFGPKVYDNLDTKEET